MTKTKPIEETASLDDLKRSEKLMLELIEREILSVHYTNILKAAFKKTRLYLVGEIE